MAVAKDNRIHAVFSTALRQTKDKIEDLSERAEERGEEFIHHSKKAVRHLQKETEKYANILAQYVKNSPLKVALIAAGIGLLISGILKK